MNPESLRHPASFRDPSGFVFIREGRAWRAIDPSYLPHYEKLMGSGLYDQLVKKGWLLPHEEVKEPEAGPYRILLPQQVACWSYPYEWSFGQLKDAALLTLRVNQQALQQDMILKDASAYNIQFVEGRPVLIDTLSFGPYEEGQAWKAFRQFCEHFLYPLLMQLHQPHTDSRLLLAYPDGIPASVVRDMLPRGKRWSINYWLYVYLPARLSGRADEGKSYRISKSKVLQNMQQLESFINRLKLPAVRTTWNDYYSDTILSNTYLDHKKTLVASWLEELKPGTVCDLGCNDGVFSELAARHARHVWSVDGDPACIETLYTATKQQKAGVILPIIADLCNPAPAGGWANAERKPLLQRLPSELVLALALVHHLCLAQNASLEMVAALLESLARQYLVVEFVPKEDPKAQLLLQQKGDIFPRYTRAVFEEAFSSCFEVLKTAAVEGSKRTLYLFRRK